MIVVHEDVVALLRVLPEVEHLRHGGDVFLRALPAEVGVDREAAGRRAVVAAQVEHGLVVADARRAGRQLVLGEIEPLVARRLAGAEQDRRHVVAVEDDRLAGAILRRQLARRPPRRRSPSGRGRRRSRGSSSWPRSCPASRRWPERGCRLRAACPWCRGTACSRRPDTRPARRRCRWCRTPACCWRAGERADLVHDAADARVELDAPSRHTCSWTSTYGCSPGAACSAGAPS